jgi:hypothetical protein
MNVRTSICLRQLTVQAPWLIHFTSTIADSTEDLYIHYLDLAMGNKPSPNPPDFYRKILEISEIR